MTPNELNSAVSEKNDGCLLKCWIQPRSSRNAVAGIYGEAVKITLTAPPVEGKANKELLKFLAVFLKLPKGGFQITAGESSRSKTVFIPDTKDSVIEKLCAER